MDRQTTSVEDDMEYLIKFLHREWEQSGKTKAEVTIRFIDLAEVESLMAEVIKDKKKQFENEKFNFRESMELSKNNFVLLRLIKKIRKAKGKMADKDSDMKIIVELDREEYWLFKDIVEIQEE